MSCFTRAVLVVALALPALPEPAHAFGRGGWTSSYYYAASYGPVVSTRLAYYAPAVYPVTVGYYAPAWQVSYVAPAPVVCPPVTSIYATPTPAPPSQTVEPPFKPAPAVSESRSGPAETPAVTVRSEPVKDSARVGFWNVTGRDLTLTVNGQTYVLARGRNLTLSLTRQFVWRVDQRAPQTEAVPAESGTLEIVVRQ
ncbi:MAG: hypothetical protein L0Z62_40560 [Gemmataceae bacterium]|nr:hypothetical protein [Gemmataceae bacterium]